MRGEKEERRGRAVNNLLIRSHVGPADSGQFPASVG